MSGPSDATRSALAAVGSMPSARISLTSCSSRNGLPPVAWWQAAAKASSAAPSSAWMRAPAPSVESGPGRIETVAGSARISASGTGSWPTSAVRTASSSTIGRSAIRRLRKRSAAIDASSAHWASSMRDQERLLAGEVRDQPVQPVEALVHELRVVALLRAAGIEDRQRELCGAREQRGALLVGLVERHRVRRLAHDAVRIAPLELGAPHRDRVHARVPGELQAEATRLDLPIPGGPSIATTLPRPAIAPASAWSSALSSASRSIRSGSDVWRSAGAIEESG